MPKDVRNVIYCLNSHEAWSEKRDKEMNVFEGGDLARLCGLQKDKVTRE